MKVVGMDTKGGCVCMIENLVGEEYPTCNFDCSVDDCIKAHRETGKCSRYKQV